MTHEYVQVRSTIKLSLWVLSLPFYIYALIKWRQFKGHFLIRKRFPVLSYTIFCIAFLGQTLSLSADFMYSNHIAHQTVDIAITYAIFSFTFAISGLILYRINLIYIKWKSVQEHERRGSDSSPSIANSADRPTLSPMTSSSGAHTKADTDLKSTSTELHNVYHTKIPVFILLFIMIGSILCYVSYIFSLFVCIPIVFAALWIFIAFSIFHIKRNNVKEEIGCIQECYAMLISVLIQMTLQMMIPNDHKHHSNILHYSTFFVLHVQALVTLYVPLLLLLKYEGTLHLQQYLHKTDNKVFVDVNASMSMHHNNNNNNIYLTTIEAQNPDRKESEAVTDKIFFNKCLFQFLYKHESNHRLFSDYLRLCFAIESLLFVERASILYRMVLELNQLDQLSKCGVPHERSEAVHNEMHSISSNCNDIPVIPASATDTHTLTLNVDHLDVRYSISSVRVSQLSVSDMDISKLSALYPEEAAIPNNASSSFQIINKKNKQRNGSSPTLTPITPSPNPHTPDFAHIDVTELKYIYRFEFLYLTRIRKRYQRMIDACAAKDDEYDVSIYKQTLYEICVELYDQFIATDAVSQVNLSGEVCRPLHHLLGANRENSVKQFQSYDDFLRLFDAAVIEAYRLMVNVYCYRFRNYVKRIYGDNVVFE